jgi:Zn finger protein HypA/HybF involved in hydrogenase expression
MKKNPRLSVILERLVQTSPQIESVNLVVGELVPFSDDEIRGQWQASQFAKTRLTIRRIPVEQQCMVCFQKYHPTGKEVACPHCGGVGAKIIAGEEFYLE